jgi:hypothetical protein
LGINKIADLDTGKVVEVFYDPSTRPISNIDVTYKYTGNQPGFFLPDVETGYVDFLRYSFFNNPQIDANGLTRIERRDDILMNIQGTDARTHQDAVRKIFPDAPEEAIQDIITRPEIIVINDPTKQYEVLGRHTIDNKNRTVQVNLIVTRRSGEVNPDTIKDFENTFYTAYLQKLREINPMEQYELRLITSYVNGDGSVAFHNMGPIVVADIDKGLPNQSVAKLGDGTNCQIGFAAQTATLVQANQNSNVLGVSTGEVLAASTGPCGPVRNFVEKIFDNPIGRMFDKIKTPINDAADTWDRLIFGTTNPETNSIDVSLYMNQIKSDIKKSEFIAATQTIEDVFPGQNFDVFSLAGSSAVIYIDKNDPTLVYKVSIKITPPNRSNLENKIETIRYREEEAKKLQILSEKNLSPKLIEYIPAKYTDEEAKLLADPSFAPREQNQLLEQTTLLKSAKESDREIIVMEKLEKDPIGFSKLSQDPVKKQAEIDKVVNILEETEFFPGDTEMIIDKSGSIKYVDLGGMSPMYPGSRFEGMSIREAVEASFESGIRSEQGQMRN